MTYTEYLPESDDIGYARLTSMAMRARSYLLVRLTMYTVAWLTISTVVRLTKYKVVPVVGCA